ncbi:hypothetical protein D917_02310 [Trichinella nativa]|uniref:Uncharacterized protein n=1 Tax=Trichinella nativa TaxID=6335 RepID=A0A1Y3EHE2_9BILA|nr:hypothetical protein D917_02310 [Trichinella nativa]
MSTIMCLLISCKIIFHIDLHCMPNRFMFYDGFYIDLSSRAVYCSILKLMFRLISGKVISMFETHEGRDVNDELRVCSGAAAFAYKRNVFYFYNACRDAKWILAVVTGSDELL